jgi:hypothetical protein
MNHETDTGNYKPKDIMHGPTPGNELFGAKTDGTKSKSTGSIIEPPTNALKSFRETYANLDVTAHIKLIRTQGLDIEDTIAAIEIKNQFTEKPSDLPEEKPKKFLKERSQRHSQIGKSKTPTDYINSQMQRAKKSRLPRP